MLLSFDPVPNIRLATIADAQAILEIYAPIVRDTPTSFELAPPTVDDIAARVAKTVVDLPWLVCEKADGTVAGYAYAARHRERAAYQWGVDVTVYVHPLLQRSGVARALYSSLFRVLCRQGFYNAYAAITLPNDASVGLHIALGFQSIGIHHHTGYKLGRWHDVSWWELTLQPHVNDPPPPRSFSSLLRDDDIIVLK